MKRFNISLPDELVELIDKVAKASYMGRSDFIREAVVEKIRTQPMKTDAEPLSDNELMRQFRQIKQELAHRDLYKDEETRGYVRRGSRQT